jgi:hypothetical protein
MFEKVNNRVFLGTQHPAHQVTELAKAQIAAFNKQGFSVIVNIKKKPVMYLAEGHVASEIKKEVVERIR